MAVFFPVDSEDLGKESWDLCGLSFGWVGLHAPSSSSEEGGGVVCFITIFGQWHSSEMHTMCRSSAISIAILQLIENRQSVRIVTLAQSKPEYSTDNILPNMQPIL